jgi:hypothetical protein
MVIQRLVVMAGLLAAAAPILAASPPARSGAGAVPLRIIATDARFRMPARIPAGLRHIVFENRGRQIHEAMLVRLPPTMDMAAYLAAVRNGALFPPGARDYSGAALTSPGETTELWLRLDPGEYVVICWNGDHARTRAAHALQVVAAGAHDDPPPPVDTVLQLRDYRFEMTHPLRAGVQVIRVDTIGPSMHEADLYRLLEGRSVADLVEWRRRDGAGAAPVVALGGMLDSHDLSRQVWLRRSFTPGRYAWHCEMPMSADAKAGSQYATHADAGMVLQFDVAP